MNEATRTLVFIASALGVGVASGLIPLVNIELYVAYLGVVAPPALRPLLLVVVTAAHMAGKAALYRAGRQADRLPEGALRQRVVRARATMAGRANLGAATIFVSAVTGVPPFFLVTVASGALRYRLLHFVVLGFVGRLLRLAVLLVAPGLLCRGEVG